MKMKRKTKVNIYLCSSGTGYVSVLDGIAQEFIDNRIRQVLTK
jgi:hypothetical protein